MTILHENIGGKIVVGIGYGKYIFMGVARLGVIVVTFQYHRIAGRTADAGKGNTAFTMITVLTEPEKRTAGSGVVPFITLRTDKFADRP